MPVELPLFYALLHLGSWPHCHAIHKMLVIGANKAESHPLYIGSGCCISNRQSYPLALHDSMAIVWSRETLSEGLQFKKIKHCK
jgi:hypothetical protein